MNILRMFVIATVFLFSGLCGISDANGATYTLNPTADTFVDSEISFQATNFGTAEILVSEYYQYGGLWLYSYLKFDMSGLPNNEVITGATLRLYQLDGSGSVSGTNLYRISDDTWSETGITWVNQPSEAGSFMATNSLYGTYVGWVAWDLFQNAVWASDIDRTDGTLSLRITQVLLIPGDGLNGNSEAHYYYSKEVNDSTYRPILEITTSTVPLPGAFLLFAPALMTLVAVRKRLRR